uniref:Lipase domain-containing protein n=1 Tax=Macrostomum lignano TaxID=282301 RepID=A0A1I8IAF5_9PLAT
MKCRLPLLLLSTLLLTFAPLSTLSIDLDEYVEPDIPDYGDEDIDEDERFLVKTSVCYGDLGCFSIKGKYFNLLHRPVVVVPQSPEVIGTKFLLFTRRNPASPAELHYKNAKSVLRSRFSNRRPTKLVIHGFLGKGVMGWMNRIRQAMLKRVDCNLIQVRFAAVSCIIHASSYKIQIGLTRGEDNEFQGKYVMVFNQWKLYSAALPASQVGWAGGSVTLYNQATSNTRVVGAVVARMLRWLHSRFGVDLDNVHVIGFSLGGHIAGYVGRRLRERGTPLGRITGLDPAGPYFEGTDPVVRLDPTDAKFVDAIHTDGALWRVGLPLLNWVTWIFLSTAAATSPAAPRWAPAITAGPRSCTLDTLKTAKSKAFSAFPCDNYDKFMAGDCGSHCPSGGCPVMGLDAEKYKARLTGSRLPHRYYLLTGPCAPYSVVHYHVTLRLSSKSPSGRTGGLKVQLSSGGKQCGPVKLAVDERRLSPGSRQRGVFGCTGWWSLAASAPAKLEVSWTDESTFGSWFGYRIKLDSAVLTEMVSGRAHRYCGYGSFKGGD